MNLLALVQTACAELGLASPGYAVGNTSTDIAQQVALLNALGNELRADFPWQALQTEYRFSTQYTTQTGTLTAGSAMVTGLSSTAGLDSTYMVMGTGTPNDCYVASVDSATQVTLSQAATITGSESITFAKTKYAMPADFDRIEDSTEWDKSKRWQMGGPLTAQEWQWLKSGYISTAPRVRWRIFGGTFQTWPPLAANEYLGFEYVSNGWVTDAAGVAKSVFTADTDVCIFPDRLMILGLKKKYFEIKGFDATALTRDYEAFLSQAKAQNGGARKLNMMVRPSDSFLLGLSNIPDSGYGG